MSTRTRCGAPASTIDSKSGSRSRKPVVLMNATARSACVAQVKASDRWGRKWSAPPVTSRWLGAGLRVASALVQRSVRSGRWSLVSHRSSWCTSGHRPIHWRNVASSASVNLRPPCERSPVPCLKLRYSVPPGRSARHSRSSVAGIAASGTCSRLAQHQMPSNASTSSTSSKRRTATSNPQYVLASRANSADASKAVTWKPASAKALASRPEPQPASRIWARAGSRARNLWWIGAMSTPTVEPKNSAANLS